MYIYLYIIQHIVYFLTVFVYMSFIFGSLVLCLTGGTINRFASLVKNSKPVKCLYLEGCKLQVKENIKGVLYNSVFMWGDFN